MSRRCGGCGNPMRTAGRLVHVVDGRTLKRVRACPTCFRECIHLLVAAPLQLTRAPRRKPELPVSLLDGSSSS
jgi:hypothetical protein